MTDKQIIIYKKECYNEPHCSLNQVLEQLNAYKMEADEGKEINAELKAENEELKEILNEGCLHNLTLMTEQRVLLQTLTEIKEIAERGFKHSQCNCGAKADLDLILQKISECEGNDELTK
jgi:hypothetical protein